MAIEDFTTYTEVDSGGDITITSTKCDVDTMQKVANSYVYKSYGAGHFGNFEHLITYYSGTSSANSAQAGIWLVGAAGETIADAIAADNAMLVGNYRHWDTGVKRIDLRDLTNNNLDTYTAADSTLYYLTIERNSTTLTCKIYSDSDRTNLLDTLTLVCTNTTYEYVQPCMSADLTGTMTWTYYTENLDLQEAGAETHTPGDTAKASDGVAFSVKEALGDTAKATDSPAFKPGFPLSDLAKASDSVTFKVFHSVNDTAKAQDIIFPNKLTLTDVAKANDSVTYSFTTAIETPTENITIYR